jgi:Fe-S-cluster containining protein
MTGQSPVVRLSAGVPGEPVRNGQVVLVVGGEELPLELSVPAGPVTMERLLPILRGLSSLFSERATARAKAAGRPITCRAGCGACCRQLVALAPSEARAIARLVDTMPEPRRAVIHQRFDVALQRLGDLVDRMPTGTAEERAELSHAYFKLGIACPFLEDESCSIHPDRPMACREYLVSSPAENCRMPRPDNTDKLALDAYVLPTLVEVEAGGWAPLLLALRFRDENPEPAPSREAPAILREVIGRLVTEP